MLSGGAFSEHSSSALCGRAPAPETGRGSSSSNLGVDSLDDLQVVQEAVLRRKFAGLEFEANLDAAEWKSE